MNIDELVERIRRWENLHTEFKKWPVHPDDLAAGLVAFANTDGGQLIVGVDNKQQICGIEDSDRVTRAIDNVAWNNCEPPITVIQEVLDPGEKAAGKSVIVINIPKGEQRPYRTNKGVYYVRTTSGRRQASREELLRLFQASVSIFYDETPLVNLSLADLDLNAFENFLNDTGQADLGVDFERLLRNWRLLANGYPTIAGLVLFGRYPQQHLPFAQINAARFPGMDISEEPIDVKILAGRLLDVIDQAKRFVYLHLKIPHNIRGFEPEARPELPEEALREAIVNAVAHRDYTIRGPIRLFILDDRIEFHTPGRAPHSVDEEAMRSGVHVVRNPHIYARLADAGMVTRAGSGIRRIIRLVKEATGRDIMLDLKEFEVKLMIPKKQLS